MASVVRLLARVTVAAALLALPTLPSHGNSVVADGTLAAGENASAASGQVRLRKLHLVRPDLIPYPIAYEVCC